MKLGEISTESGEFNQCYLVDMYSDFNYFLLMPLIAFQFVYSGVIKYRLITTEFMYTVLFRSINTKMFQKFFLYSLRLKSEQFFFLFPKLAT